MAFEGMLWDSGIAGPDPALPLTSPRVVDATGAPGDVVVGAGVRVIKVKFPFALTEVVITHPEITAASCLADSWGGNDTADPEATRRWSCRPTSGSIVVNLSGASVQDGPVTVYVVAV